MWGRWLTLLFLKLCGNQCSGKTRSWLCAFVGIWGRLGFPSNSSFTELQSHQLCYCLGHKLQAQHQLYHTVCVCVFFKENKHIGVFYAYASHAGSAHACSAHGDQKKISDDLELKVVSSSVCARIKPRPSVRGLLPRCGRWYTTLISALRKWRRRISQFKGGLFYIASSRTARAMYRGSSLRRASHKEALLVTCPAIPPVPVLWILNNIIFNLPPSKRFGC